MHVFILVSVYIALFTRNILHPNNPNQKDPMGYRTNRPCRTKYQGARMNEAVNLFTLLAESEQ